MVRDFKETVVFRNAALGNLMELNADSRKVSGN